MFIHKNPPFREDCFAEIILEPNDGNIVSAFKSAVEAIGLHKVSEGSTRTHAIINYNNKYMITVGRDEAYTALGSGKAEQFAEELAAPLLPHKAFRVAAKVATFIARAATRTL